MSPLYFSHVTVTHKMNPLSDSLSFFHRLPFFSLFLFPFLITRIVPFCSNLQLSYFSPTLGKNRNWTCCLFFLFFFLVTLMERKKRKKLETEVTYKWNPLRTLYWDWSIESEPKFILGSVWVAQEVRVDAVGLKNIFFFFRLDILFFEKVFFDR